MPYLRQSGELIFTSSREVIVYYTTIIDELIPQLKGITQDNYQAVQAEIAALRQELANHLKNFGRNDIHEYFTRTMVDAESEQEYYGLSNAYEDLLIEELNHIKAKLQILRNV